MHQMKSLPSIRDCTLVLCTFTDQNLIEEHVTDIIHKTTELKSLTERYRVL